MIFWIVTIAVTVVVVGLMARPFFNRHLRTADSAAYDVEVYRSQLTELDREKAEGLIGSAEADAARTEIARRLLAADARRSDSTTTATAGRLSFTALLLAVATPGAAIALYLWIGSPGLQDHPYSARTAEVEQARAAASPGSLEVMADRITKRIDDEGGSLDDWVMLARTNMTLQRFAAAAEAFLQAGILEPGSAQLKSSYGEALVFGSQGAISEQAEFAFKEALALDPADARARFYLAEGEWQKGYRNDALEHWIDMISSASPAEPWLPTVRERALEAAAELGVDITDRLPEPIDPEMLQAFNGPTPEEMEAAQNMSEEERQAMIEGMVRSLAAQLEANPMDFQGWQRLIRSRVVLGEMETAQADLDRALQVFQNAPFPKQRLMELAQELDLDASAANVASTTRGPTAEDIEAAQDMSEEDQQAMIQGMVDGLAERLKDEPMDFQGWQMLIRSRIVLGDMANAQRDLDTALQHFKDAPFPKKRLTDMAAELGLNTETATVSGPMAEDIEAAQDMPEEDQQAMIRGMVEGLAERLANDPNNLEGWLQLAQSYNVLGMPLESLEALKSAEETFPNNTTVLLLEARVRRSIANAPVTAETNELMQRVLAIEPQNVEALWFTAVSYVQDGDNATAKTFFDQAIDALPEGSEERPALIAERDRILALP